MNKIIAIAILAAAIVLVKLFAPKPRSQVKEFIVTAYCPNSCCCGSFSDSVTASGHKIQEGDKFCAAPANIPFGTKIDIPGYGLVRVEDRGGAITKGRLDIYFFLHQDALNWGRKKLKVRIYSNSK